MEFYYNSTEYSTIGISPFELAWKVETWQPMDVTISKVGRTHCNGGKNVEKMVKIHVERKNVGQKVFGKIIGESWKKNQQVLKTYWIWN